MLKTFSTEGAIPREISALSCGLELKTARTVRKPWYPSRHVATGDFLSIYNQRRTWSLIVSLTFIWKLRFSPTEGPDDFLMDGWEGGEDKPLSIEAPAANCCCYYEDQAAFFEVCRVMLHYKKIG